MHTYEIIYINHGIPERQKIRAENMVNAINESRLDVLGMIVIKCTLVPTGS